MSQKQAIEYGMIINACTSADILYMKVSRMERQEQEPREGQFASSGRWWRAQQPVEAKPQYPVELHGAPEDASYAIDDPDWLNDLA